MITFLQPLPIGNAVRGLLAPPAGAERVRVLRKMSDTFTGADDPAAGVVYEGDEQAFLDASSLTNGEVYYYKPYYLVAAAWVAGGALSATPAATAEMLGPDPLALVRERMELGLRVEVVAGELVHEDGYIPCLKAPPLFNENGKWPVVSVHLRGDSRAYSAIGELVAGDIFESDDDVWVDSEGQLSRITIDVVGWCINASARNDLYRAIKKVVFGNFPVFADAGMSEVEASFTNPDDTESYNSPVYMTVASISCVAPTAISSITPPIDDVTVAALAAA